LALSGYLGNAPLNLSIGVSIKTLEMYRRIQFWKPSFIIEAFTKVICDLYSVSFYVLLSEYYTDILQVPYHHTILRDKFDLYLAVLHIVDKQVSQALGGDMPNWCVLNGMMHALFVHTK
jgi:hypothetical protein